MSVTVYLMFNYRAKLWRTVFILKVVNIYEFYGMVNCSL